MTVISRVLCTVLSIYIYRWGASAVDLLNAKPAVLTHTLACCQRCTGAAADGQLGLPTRLMAAVSCGQEE